MSVTRLIPKGKLGTCATVVDSLVDRIPTMTEIYVVIKDEDGTSKIYFNGHLEGLTFAILMLQDMAINALNGELPE